VAVLGLLLRAERYQRWHEDPAIAARTSFFAAAAVVNRAMACHALLSRFLLDLGARLEVINTHRAHEIRAGQLYGEGSVEVNTLDFVHYEQSIVQDHLDRLRHSAPRSYGREIRAVNAMFAALRWGVIRGFANRCFLCAVEEALQRLGGPLDFAEQRCRVVLGTQIARQAVLANMLITTE
jgi:hypothetical protein